MRSVQKIVFYCDHCRRHGLSRAAMEKHEKGCTLNPQRVCRWRIDGHSNGERVMDIAPLAAALLKRATRYPISSDPEAEERTYLTKEDIDWLRGEVDGCPVCMLAALRQSGVDDFHHAYRGGAIFDYPVEVERLRAEERDEARGDMF